MPALGRVGVIVAARRDSRRLPDKALASLGGKPMLRYLLDRLAGLTRAEGPILATTERPIDDPVAAVAVQAGVAVVRGQTEDLIARYLKAGQGFDTLVRVTADCPFLDAGLIDRCLEQAEALLPFDLATTKERFPVGLDCEIFSYRVLERLAALDDLSEAEREHLTLGLYDPARGFRVRRLSPPAGWSRSETPFTVDLPCDLALARARAAQLGDPLAPVDVLLSRPPADDGPRRAYAG